jgi:hypothetical protein
MLPTRFQTVQDIETFIAAQPAMVTILRAVEALDLPDCWIGAGFVRNAVWDALHDRPWSASHGDIDVAFFDGSDANPARDRSIEIELGGSIPGERWSVKNQARMHIRNGDSPYMDTADALRHWPETCTAVAARSVGRRIELLAPFGIRDLASLIVSPTPAFALKIEIYRRRIVDKAWAERWPRLQTNLFSAE